MNGLDVLLIVAIAAATAVGYRRGATMQLFSYGGLLLGLLVGALLAPRLATLASGRDAQTAIATSAFLLSGALGNGIGWIVGARVSPRARHSRLGQLDATGGSLVALVASLLAIWFVALNLANGPFPGVASEVRGSAIVRGLGATLPDPPSVVGEVRRFFDRFGFPEVFEGIPPEPAGPVGGPSPKDAKRAFQLAEASTVKIVGQACDRIQEGSGFIVKDGYVVTNAHVVAGVRAPEVSDSDGAGGSATVVLFDPELDVAVLRVDATLGPSLPLDTSTVDRGAAGAVLGYPGGGPLTGDGAAVRQTIDALGHDIYGRHDVSRNVYELQTTVRPGNSGGPFVLPDGTVAGVVFAASSVDPKVGYAIATGEIVRDVQLGTTRTTPASTGACLR